MKKRTIITLGDHPLYFSGVGKVCNQIFRSLLDTGRYRIISLGGALKHEDMRPQITEDYGDDWVIHPVNSFGTPEMVRSIVYNEKSSALFMMTDPRFFSEWFFPFSFPEISKQLPIVWNSIWDSYPFPRFNKALYDSCDKVVCISKLTKHLIEQVSDIDIEYIPHAIDLDIFKPLSDKKIIELRKERLGRNIKSIENKFIFLYVSRNARRKNTTSLIFSFKDFLDKVGHDKAILLMKTDPRDMAGGSDLVENIKALGLDNGQVVFSNEPLPEEMIAEMHGIADCHILPSNAEGFGLSVAASLAVGVPNIATLTGGMVDQMIDDDGEFTGIPLHPVARPIVGGGSVHHICEDIVSNTDITNAMFEIYNMPKEERRELGAKARRHAEKNFDLKNHNESWIRVVDELIEKHGSWPKKNFKSYCLEEIKQTKKDYLKDFSICELEEKGYKTWIKG